MEVDRIKLRTWSMLGQRATFGTILTELAPKYDNLVAISADFTRSSGLNRFKEEYPDKFFSVGIAEQNMIGVASGLATEGYNAFATSFASFIATRSYEHIKIHAGYMQNNIKLVGLASGFGVEYQGNTHYGLDDISLMRNIPNLTIVSPADCLEVVKTVEALCEYNGPVYLRLCGESNNPMVYKADYDFEIGKAIPLREGQDVAIYATGTMVHHSLKAAKLLEDEGISCSVVNIHTINPIDDETILKYATNAKLIVTAEEGFISGGLNPAVMESLSKNSNQKYASLAIGLTGFPHAGSYKYMLSENGLDAEGIARQIKEKYSQL